MICRQHVKAWEAARAAARDPLAGLPVAADGKIYFTGAPPRPRRGAAGASAGTGRTWGPGKAKEAAYYYYS